MWGVLALLNWAAPIFCTDSRVMLRNVNAKIHLCQTTWHHISGGERPLPAHAAQMANRNQVRSANVHALRALFS
jgi:hypothetical protein